MASSTRGRGAARTCGLPLRTRETVPTPTPARIATSAMRTLFETVIVPRRPRQHSRIGVGTDSSLAAGQRSIARYPTDYRETQGCYLGRCQRAAPNGHL